MFGSTTLLTVGHALDRAREEGMPVRVNVAGEWVTGRILNNDGHGVAILESSGDLCVVRQEAVSAVRMPSHASGPHVPSQGTEYAAHAPEFAAHGTEFAAPAPAAAR